MALAWVKLILTAVAKIWVVIAGRKDPGTWYMAGFRQI